MQQRSADIAIIGPYPRPYGGVAVHVQRLLPHLDRAGMRWHVYNPSGPHHEPGRITSVASHSSRWFASYLLTGRERIVVVHTSQWLVLASSWWLARARAKRVIVVVHSEGILWALDAASAAKRAAILGGLSACYRVVAVSEAIAGMLRARGVPAGRIQVIHAFIAPDWVESERTPLPPAVQKFLDQRNGPVVLGSGAAVERTQGDVYGVDLAIGACEQLRRRWPDLRWLWVMMDPLGNQADYERALRARLAPLERDGVWLTAAPDGPLHPWMLHVDALARPTRTDGDALTVREALAAGLPVVASDAALRPSGVRLFRAGDSVAFVAALTDTLEALRLPRRMPPAPTPAADSAPHWVALLRQALDDNR